MTVGDEASGSCCAASLSSNIDGLNFGESSPNLL